MAIGLWLLAGFLALKAYIVWLVARSSLGLEFGPCSLEKVKAEALPEGLEQAFELALGPLARLGFEHAAWLRGPAIVRIPGFPMHAALLLHREEPIFAWVAADSLPEIAAPLRVVFYTVLRGGDLLSTINGYPLDVENDGEIASAVYVDSVEEQLAAHRQRIAELLRTTNERSGLDPSGIPRSVDLAGALAALRESAERSLRGMQRRGELAPAGPPGVFRLGIRFAFRRALSLRSRLRDHTAWLRRATERAKASGAPPIPLVLRETAYRRERALEAAPRPRALRIGLLVASSLLFLASFSWGFGFIGALVLAAVVAFHELGHWAGMRAFGYRDTSIFLVPFFGGLATGQRAEATATQRLLVALLGPVPGLALGLAIWSRLDLEGTLFHSATADQVAAWTASTLVWANFLNLLPVLPLDGGRIAHLLFFTRRPGLELVFRVVAVAALATWGLAFDEPVITVLAAFSGWTLPMAIRQSRAGRAILARDPTCLESEAALCRAAFAWIEESPLRTTPYAAKYFLVRALAAQGIDRAPGPTASLFFALLYVVCLGLAPVLLWIRVVT
jgi:Zn-dependent protease